MTNEITINETATALVDIFMPRKCLVCGNILTLRERYICIFCLTDFPRTYFSKMPRNQMADRFNEFIQRDVESSDGNMIHEYVNATALFFYNAADGYRNITKSLKYRGAIGVGRFFGRILGELMAASPLYKDIDAVVPVPLHWTRMFTRGYNQAAVIAAELADCLGAEIFRNMLSRCRRTRSQTRLSIEAKARNVATAFKVSKTYSLKMAKGAIKAPLHILLVDDVFTTGATMHACYKALRSVLPSSTRISIATLAAVGR